MKKIGVYIFVIICLVFFIPIFFTAGFNFESENSIAEEHVSQEVVDKTPYDYSEFGTINLINAETNEISTINMEEYLLRSSVC